MSRINIEQKTIEFLKQHAGSVSKAVWPSSVRRCVAIGKGRRRIMILKRFLLPHRLRTLYFLDIFNKMQLFCKRLLTTCSCTIHVIIIAATGDIVQILCVLYNRPILLVLTVICTTTTLLVIYLTPSNVQREHKDIYLFKNKFKVLSLRKEERHLIEARLAASPLASILYPEYEDEELEHQSALISFPDTPVPTAPLTRVMETINLSSTEVDHFLTLRDPSGAKPTREEHDRHIGMSPPE